MSGSRIPWTLERLKGMCVVDGDCWLWQKYTDRNGYPHANIDGRSTSVRNWVVKQSGKYPTRKRWAATSSCGRITCCSPLCTQAKTYSEVNRDTVDSGARNMVAIGRKSSQTVAAKGGTKLTPADVVLIRSDPRGARVLSKHYGVAMSLIARIKRGEAWKHVQDTRGRSVFDYAQAA
jgi:hypothetical protein